MTFVPLINRVASAAIVMPIGPLVVNSPATQVPGVEPLRMAFEVQRGTSGREPPRAKIVITNLSPPKRKAIVSASRRIDGATLPPLVAAGIAPLADGTLFDAAAAMSRITLTAGYLAIQSIIFDGTITRAIENRSGPDWDLEIEAGDAAAATALVSCRRPFPPGATAYDIVASLANICATPLAYAPPKLALDIQLSGYIPGARARDDLYALLDATDLDWWIDQGMLWVTERGKPLPLPPINISDQPVPGSYLMLERGKQAEGFRCELVTQLIPSIAPGQKIRVISKDVIGSYRVESITHAGDLTGNEWQTRIVAQIPPIL